jgi:hypothetical protein
VSLHGSQRRRAALLGLLLLFAWLDAGARTAGATDTQWWQELDLVGSFADRWSYLVAGFSRFSDTNPNPALTGEGAFLTWTSGAIGYSLGYLHAQVRLPSSGARLDADLPVAAVTGSLNAGAVHCSDTLRMEDLIGVPGNPWRYRNLLSISAYPGAARAPLKALAISDEVFIDLTSERMTRNRLLMGPMFAVGERLELSLAYVNQHDVDKRPGRIQGMLLDVMVRL